MLQICEQYATKHAILFNPLKSLCMYFCKCKTLCSPCSILFKLRDIEFVESCKLLGAKMSRDITDRHMYFCIRCTT